MSGAIHLPALSRYAVLRSKRAEEVEEKLHHAFGASEFRVFDGPELLDVEADAWSSPRLSLSYCSYRAGVRVTFPEVPTYRQQIPLSGSALIRPGKTVYALSATNLRIVAPSTELNVEFSRDYRQLVLQLQEGYLNALASTLVGAASTRRLEFSGAVDTERPAYKSFLRRLAFFIQEINLADQSGSVWAIRELESMLAASFIYANPSNYSKYLEAPEMWLGTGLVRRIEEYIEANFSRAITIEELASVASASVRTVFDHFRRTRGYSPIRFLRRVRLENARAMLLQPEAHTTVTQVAMSCGFSNLGHFARDYRETFGEKPSQTLAEAKQRRC